MNYEHIPDSLKHVVDAVCGAITVSVIMGWIANATAVLSLLWILIRLKETKTMQGWLGKRRRASDRDPMCAEDCPVAQRLIAEQASKK